MRTTRGTVVGWMRTIDPGGNRRVSASFLQFTRATVACALLFTEAGRNLVVSAPRQLLEGTTYLLTRRCMQRQLLLRPSAEVNRIFQYCLAVAAERTGVELHAFCVLSNHYHIVATDPGARLPEFMHWLNTYVAKSMNSLLGRWEAFWSPGSYSAVALAGPDDVLRGIVYTLTNPVAAGLVDSWDVWPGLRSETAHGGKLGWTAKRPRLFFRQRGDPPATSEIRLVRPRAFTELNDDAFRTVLESEVARRQEEMQRAFASRKQSFLGRRGVLRQSPNSRPRSRALRRGLKPRIACRDKWRRAELLRLMSEFLRAYREAWNQFSRGCLRTIITILRAILTIRIIN